MERDEDQTATPASGDLGGVADAATDPLLALRAALDAVDQLPLDERATVFDRTHQVVVEELRSLELG